MSETAALITRLHTAAEKCRTLHAACQAGEESGLYYYDAMARLGTMWLEVLRLLEVLDATRIVALTAGISDDLTEVEQDPEVSSGLLPPAQVAALKERMH